MIDAPSGARLYVNGFEGLDSDFFSQLLVLSDETSTVRTGSHAAKFTSDDFGSPLSAPLSIAAQTRVFMRAYLNIDQFGTSARDILRHTTNGSIQSSESWVRLNLDGTLSLMSGASTVLGTTTQALTTDTWYRIEFGIDTTNDIVALRIDGVDELGWLAGASMGSISTCTFGLGSGTDGSDVCIGYFDDLAIDALGWCGEGKVVALAPSGAGTLTNSGGTFTKVGSATTKWESLADTDDTTYVTTPASTTARETYAFADLPGGAVAVRGVSYWLKGISNTSGVATVKVMTLYRSNGDSASFNLQANFGTVSWFVGQFGTTSLDQLPTGGWWSVDRVNSAEYGILASDATDAGNIYRFGIQVDYTDTTGAMEPPQRAWLEGFEDGLGFYSITGTGAASTVQARSGVGSFRINPVGSTASFVTIPANWSTEVFVRFWVRVHARPASGSTMRLFQWGSSTIGVTVRMDENGKIRLEDNTGLLGAGYSSTAIALDTWTRIDVRVRQSTTTTSTDGIAQLKLSGTLIQTETSVKTAQTTAPAIRIGTGLAPGASGCDVYFDDLSIDTSAWVYDSNQVLFGWLAPTGAGALSTGNATATGAASKWDTLDELPPDDNTSYTQYGTSTSNIESYQLADTSGSVGQILGVQLNWRGIRDGATNGSIQAGTRQVTGSYLVTDSAVTQTSAYASNKSMRTAGPVKGRWTDDLLDDCEFWVKNNSANASRVTSVGVAFEYLVGSVTSTLDTVASGIVQEQGKTKEVVADGIVAIATTLELVADGLIQASVAKEVVADGLVQAFDSELDAVADGLVVDLGVPQTLDVVADGLVQITLTTETIADGYVAEAKTLDLTTDGYVVSTSGTATKDVVADGVVKAVQTLSVTADGYVSTSALGGRFVLAGSGSDWHSPSTWLLGDAEETSGTQLVHPKYARELRWTAGSAYSCGGFLIPVPGDAVNDPGGTLTIELGSVSGGVLTAITSATLPASARVASAGVEFYHVRWASPVALTSGHEYYVLARPPVNNVAPQVVVAKRTIDGIASFVLNGIVVSETAPSAMEPRSMVLAPFVTAGVRGSRSVTYAESQSVAYRNVQLCPGVSLTLSAGVDTKLPVGKVLQIGAGASLSMAPTGSHTASVVFSEADAGLIVNGTLSCAGTAKDRVGILELDLEPGATSFDLLDAPSGWLAGDRILLQTTTQAVSEPVVIATMVAEMVTVDNPVVRFHENSAAVVNLTRSVSIVGAGITQLTSLRINAGATVTLHETLLRYLGPSTAIAPSDQATVALRDVVICDGATMSSQSGATALIPGALTTCETITVYRYRTAAVFKDGQDHTGLLIVADQNVAHAAIIVQGTSRLEALGMGINGSLINVWSGGNFTGQATNRWAYGPGASLIGCVAGVVNRILLTGGIYEGISGNGAAIYVGPAGGIGEAILATVGSNTAPALLVDSGTNFVGKMRLRNCRFIADPLVVLVGSAFVDLIDEDHEMEEGSILTDGSILPGSRVSTRNRTEEYDGFRERSTARAYAGSTSAKIEAYPGHEYVVELGRYVLQPGETLTVAGAVFGDAWLRLRNADTFVEQEVNSPGAWGTGSVTSTLADGGVLVLEVRVNGSSVWVDRFVRV